MCREKLVSFLSAALPGAENRPGEVLRVATVHARQIKAMETTTEW